MGDLEQRALLVPLVLRDYLDVQVIPDKVHLGLLVHRVSQGTVDQDLKETGENQDFLPAQVHTTLDLLDLRDLQDRRAQQGSLDQEVNQETQFLIAEYRLCRDLQAHQDHPGAQDHRASKGILEYLVFLDHHEAHLVLQDPQDHLDSQAPSRLPVRCGSTSLIT